VSRPAPLEPALEQAHKRQHEALQKLAEQQQKLARVEQQLADLRRYRDEYAMPGAGGLTVAALLNRQQFVERIDGAIVQQLAEVERQRRMLDHLRGAWQAAHSRELALDSVIARRRDEERRREDSREQAELDERSQYRRPHAGGRR
jgi:flagellar FliJ protein